MKKRRLLSAFLAASLLCTMAPPATVLAAETNTEAVDEQASTRSGISGGSAGDDYRIEGDTVTILTSTPITFSGREIRYNVIVPESVTANVTLEEETGINIYQIGTGGVLNLSQNGEFASWCYLGNYGNSTELNGTLNINDIDGSGEIYLDVNYDIRGNGSVIVNNGTVSVSLGHQLSLDNFIVNQGNVRLSYYDSGYLTTNRFEIHGGDIEFDISQTTRNVVVNTTKCTIDGGQIAVQDQRELYNNIFQDEFWGIVGADAELEPYNYYDNGYNRLISAETYDITGGAFYEANLSANTVYGCPIASNMTLKAELTGPEQYRNRYAVYNVVPEGSVVRLAIDGKKYDYSNHTLTLQNGANVSVRTSGQTNDQIVVEDGASATLTLNGVDMRNSKPPISLGYNSTLTLVLAESSDNSVETIGELGYAAIETKGASDLVIRGTGELNATGTAGGAAIGTSEVEPGGSQSIVIEDGVINAHGGYDAASIGGGKESSYVDVEISGGRISAEGQTGIGDGVHSRGTYITITGGDIIANGGDGAGIGGGPGSIVNRITIENGNIEAYGASGIGTGNGLWVDDHTYNSTIDYIDIGGGKIHANGSAGIGGGWAKNGALTSVGSINIYGGTVEAYGGAYGIGAGQGGIGGTFDCRGAVIRTDSISDMAHKDRWEGIFFVDTINRGQGTLLGDHVWLNNACLIEYGDLKIKDGQQLAIAEGASLTNQYGSIEVQSGGSIYNEGTLINNEGYIAVYPGGEYQEYGKGTFIGVPIEYIDQDQPEQDETVVAGVQLSKEKMTLRPGNSKRLTATVLPETAENKNVTWSSSDTNVAKVNKNGRVTAVNEGTAIITVTTEDGGFVAECKVTVKKDAPEEIDVTSVMLNKNSLTLQKDGSETLSAVVQPENATDSSVRWSSSDTAVATVDENGKVTAVGKGTAVISATTVDGGFIAQCNVTVEEDTPEVVAVENVSLDKKTLTVDIGESEKLTATVKPDNAANKNVTWSSNDEDVASVDANGRVTAISRGTATITVRTEDGNFAAQCKVTVTDPDATSTDTETKPDGSTVTTVEDVNGSSSTTIVDTNGVVDTSVSLSDSAVSDATKNDTAVILPMVGVTATTNMNTAPSVTVDLPGSAPVKVEIPVLDLTPGTVAVLVDADGNETVIPNSVLGNNGLIVTLEDGDTVKILDNTQSYSDVAASYWAKNNIDYVTSRGLFVGVDDANFAPETSMTRAMIVSVLQRYAGDTTAAAPGSDWYEGARQWAIANGISDGTNMNGNVTREQLVTMLYRYIGSPQVVGSLNSYSDNANVSPYAEQAMVWAVRNGIIGGMTADTLAPQGLATRAQVAAILERFIAWEQNA